MRTLNGVERLPGLAALALVASLAGCGACGDAPIPSGTEGRALVLGDVEREEPVRVGESMRPLAQLLAARLAEHGITHGATRVAPDPHTMGRWMADGEVDLYFDTAYPASVAREIAGARPVLRRWKMGEPEYHAIVFARAESGFSTLSDLAGSLMAFDNDASTSGYLLPMNLVLAAGLKPIPVTSPEERVEPPGLACFFTGHDESVIEWVLSGRAAAGAIDNLSWQALIPEESRAQLRILARSESHPRSFLMVRADLEPAVVETIRTALLGLHETEEGRAAFASMVTTRFDEFPEDPDASLDRIVELRSVVGPGPG